MSLLNDMLKDLDKNKQGLKSSPLIALSRKHSWFQKIPDFSPWLIAPFVCGALLLLYIYCYDMRATHTMVQPVSNDAIPQSPNLHTIAPSRIERIFIPTPDPGYTSELPSIVILTSNIVPIPTLMLKSAPERPLSTSHIETEEHSPSSLDDNININKVFTALTDAEWHDEQLNLALTEIQEDNDDHAEQILSRILTKLPRAIVARETLATLYLAEERYDSALQILDEGLQFSPHAITLNTIKARLFFEQNRPEDALTLLQPLKPEIRSNPDFYGLLAAILQSLGRNREAGNLYKLLVEIDPSNGQYWLGYGIALEQSKATKEAITAYKEVTGRYDIEPAVRNYAENRLKALQG